MQGFLGRVGMYNRGLLCVEPLLPYDPFKREGEVQEVIKNCDTLLHQIFLSLIFPACELGPIVVLHSLL